MHLRGVLFCEMHRDEAMPTSCDKHLSALGYLYGVSEFSVPLPSATLLAAHTPGFCSHYETKSCSHAVRFQKYFIFWNSHMSGRALSLLPIPTQGDRSYDERTEVPYITPAGRNDGSVWENV